ncbi:hypothetical protein J6590_054668 [Homalodisca vitripennis]|nr:hypothetical protein J6590_054668 [Homalodisca vitripennis]
MMRRGTTATGKAAGGTDDATWGVISEHVTAGPLILQFITLSLLIAVPICGLAGYMYPVSWI